MLSGTWASGLKLSGAIWASKSGLTVRVQFLREARGAHGWTPVEHWSKNQKQYLKSIFFFVDCVCGVAHVEVRGQLVELSSSTILTPRGNSGPQACQ